MANLTAWAGAARSTRLFPTFHLRSIISEHQAELGELGVPEGDDDSVLAWLAANGPALPEALVADLDRIEELSDPRSAALLRDAVREAGVDPRRLGAHPLEVAAAAFVHHRSSFERAHARRLVGNQRGTVEFRGLRPASVPPLDLASLQGLERQLGASFDVRERSPHCRITMGRDGELVFFGIARGGLVKVDAGLDDEVLVLAEAPPAPYLPERTVRYRPLRQDEVVYDGRAGVLRVRAPDAPTIQAYRRGFGELLFGDPDWFGVDPILSLEPLLRGPGIERPTMGLESVTLVGLIVRFDEDDGGVMALDSRKIWSFLASRCRGGLSEGTLVEATFRVFRMGCNRSSLVRLRTPNRVEYGRLEESLFRPWLEARGFLSRPEVRVAG